MRPGAPKGGHEFKLAAMCFQSLDATLNRVTVTCLVVDDSARFLKVGSSLLARNGIDVVGTAHSAAEALSRAAELHPDVVLVDIELGGDSGFELTRELATIERSSVILISSYAEADFTDLVQASPALGFLPKAELSARAVLDLLGPVRCRPAGTRPESTCRLQAG